MAGREVREMRERQRVCSASTVYETPPYAAPVFVIRVPMYVRLFNEASRGTATSVMMIEGGCRESLLSRHAFV